MHGWITTQRIKCKARFKPTEHSGTSRMADEDGTSFPMLGILFTTFWCTCLHSVWAYASLDIPKIPRTCSKCKQHHKNFSQGHAGGITGLINVRPTHSGCISLLLPTLPIPVDLCVLRPLLQSLSDYYSRCGPATSTHESELPVCRTQALNPCRCGARRGCEELHQQRRRWIALAGQLRQSGQQIKKYSLSELKERWNYSFHLHAMEVLLWQ